MLETILWWILIIVGSIVMSPVILGVLGLFFALALAVAFYVSIFVITIGALILAAIASPFVMLFEKIKSRKS